MVGFLRLKARTFSVCQLVKMITTDIKSNQIQHELTIEDALELQAHLASAISCVVQQFNYN
jgi:hypothetical protein